MRRVFARLRRLELHGSQYCFDEIIRDRDRIIVAKNLDDVKDLTPKVAEGLRGFSDFVKGVPIIVSREEGGERLEDNIIYTRYRLPVVTPQTLEKILNGSEEPLIYVSKGGVYVKLRGEELRRAREEKGMSRGELARALGVTRRTILYYEKGLSDASIQVAAKMEEYVGSRVFARLSLEEVETLIEETGRRRSGTRLSVRDEAIGKVLSILSRMGFREYLFSRSPFDAGAKKESVEEPRLLIGKEKVAEEPVEEILDVTESRAILLSEGSGVKEGGRVLILPKEKVEEIKRHVGFLVGEEN